MAKCIIIITLVIVIHAYSTHTLSLLQYFFRNKPVPIVLTTLKVPNPHLHRMRKYQVPNPTVTLNYPKGFSISIPDSEGITELILGININKAFNYNNDPFMTPDLFVRVNQTYNDRWTYENTYTEFNLGDYIFYWLGVKDADDKMYFKHNQYFRIGILNKHLIIMNSYDHL